VAAGAGPPDGLACVAAPVGCDGGAPCCGWGGPTGGFSRWVSVVADGMDVPVALADASWEVSLSTVAVAVAAATGGWALGPLAAETAG